MDKRKGYRKEGKKGDASVRIERPRRGRSNASRRAPSREARDRAEGILYAGGRNAVMEALKAGLVKKLFVKTGKKDERLQGLMALAREKGIPAAEVDEQVLDRMVPDLRHQGAAAELVPYEYADLEDVLSASEGRDPVLILLDGIEDVRNLGAIIRTAECSGAAAVLLPEHRSCQVTYVTIKTAAGAASYLPVCHIGNIRQTLEELKKIGFWVCGTDMEGESLYYEANLKGPLVIVMGAEGKGMSRLTKELCDFCVRIPMKGQVSSLNVSVAAALLLYEAARQRAVR